MITITKDIKITIDKGDVPVLKDICGLVQRYVSGIQLSQQNVSEERKQEIRKFLNIIFEGLNNEILRPQSNGQNNWQFCIQLSH